MISLQIMAKNAVFKGLVFDENDQVVVTNMVGDEAFYVVDDDGFLRHVPSEEVDSQVLNVLKKQIEENKEAIADQTVKMLGQDDIFTHAIIANQLENVQEQMQHMMDHGLPESGRAYLGMLGFKVVINHHGEVLRVDQPAAAAEDE